MSAKRAGEVDGSTLRHLDRAIPDHEQKISTYSASYAYESQQPVLGPEMGHRNTQYAVVTYPSAALHDQITQQVEYRVDVAN